MAKFQSTLPVPVPVESFSAVVSAAARSACVAAGTLPPPDQDAESSVTATVWASPVSASVNASVPAGTVGVVSMAGEPVVPASSATVADSGPLVISTP